MTEIIKIFLILPIFLILISAPFSSKSFTIDYKTTNYNLLVNCNILLIFSLLAIKIQEYQIIFLSILLLIYFYSFLNMIRNKVQIKFDKGLIFFFITYLVLAFVIVNDLNLGWDAKYFYYTKSLFFHDGLNLTHLVNFEHSKWHPHLGSYLWAFFWSIPYFENEYFGRLFYLFIYCYSIYYITNNLNKNKLINYIFFFSIILITFKYERFSGLQEILIYSLLLISSRILCDLDLKNKVPSILKILLIVNLMMWIKSEGLIYSCILIIILLLSRYPLLKEKLLITIFFALIIFIKISVYSYYGFEINSQPYSINLSKLSDINELIYKITNMTMYIGYYSIKNILFLLGTILLIYLNIDKKNKIKISVFNIYFIFTTLFVFSAYIFRDMEIVYALRTTAERIIFTLSSFYIYLIIKYLNNQLKN